MCRLRARYIKDDNNTQPNLIMHYITHSLYSPPPTPSPRIHKLNPESAKIGETTQCIIVGPQCPQLYLATFRANVCVFVCLFVCLCVCVCVCVCTDVRVYAGVEGGDRGRYIMHY